MTVWPFSKLASYVFKAGYFHSLSSQTFVLPVLILFFVDQGLAEAQNVRGENRQQRILPSLPLHKRWAP